LRRLPEEPFRRLINSTNVDTHSSADRTNINSTSNDSNNTENTEIDSISTDGAMGGKTATAATLPHLCIEDARLPLLLMIDCHNSLTTAHVDSMTNQSQNPKSVLRQGRAFIVVVAFVSLVGLYVDYDL
jgi:hypothetical protein